MVMLVVCFWGFLWEEGVIAETIGRPDSIKTIFLKNDANALSRGHKK